MAQLTVSGTGRAYVISIHWCPDLPTTSHCTGSTSFEAVPVIYSDDLVAQCTVLADKGCHHAMTHSFSKALIFLQSTSERMM